MAIDRVVFNWDREYEEFMKSRFPKNEGLYKGLTKQQEIAIKEYFKWRTKTKFEEICKNTSLHISPSKARELHSLTGGATDWIFDGIVDLGSMCGHCSLGHALRYEHYAYSPSTGRRILFGSKCVSDFFEVAPSMIRQMDSVRKETFEDIRKTLFIFYSMKGAEYKRLNYDKFPQPMMQDKTVNDLLIKRFGTGADILVNILKAGLPVPQYFIQIIKEFEIEYTRHRKLYDRISCLDGDLYNYAHRTLSNPDYFKPYRYCHMVIGESIRNGSISRSGVEDMINTIKIGYNLYGNTDMVIKAYDFKDKLKSYRKAFLVNFNGEVRPAYKNEIEREVPGLRVVYLCALPSKEWEAVCSIMWAAKGSDVALRGAYPKSRSKNFNENTINILRELKDKIQYGIDFLRNSNIEECIDNHNKYVDEVIRINNTENNDIADIVIDPKLSMAWDYLQNNKSKINIPGILNILERYTDLGRLSEKQADWLVKVAEKMLEHENKKLEFIESKPAKLLEDKKETTQMFICYDENGKRCAIINSNDVCRPMKAKKLIPSNINEINEMLELLDLNKYTKLVFMDNYSKNKMSLDVLRKFLDNIDDDAKPRYTNLSHVIGNYTIDGIKKELGFSEDEIRRYAMNIFEEEGVIDEFLKNVTLAFLKYRKEIKQGLKQ